jgi:ribonuclease J
LPQELKYKIDRGGDKIGANRIDIIYKDTNILLELGQELDTDEKLNEGQINDYSMHYDGVVISHYHSDHAGLINKIRCPVYMGQATHKILQIMDENMGKQPSSYYYKIYYGDKSFKIGDITITPYLCDHSAYDSYMLLFEAGGKSILYTGDFRFHGWKSPDKLLAKLPKKVNTLIYEGTNVGRDCVCIKESELAEEAAKVMLSHKDRPVFVLQATTNIDRLVSFYKASNKAKRRAVYMDYKQARVVKGTGNKHIPQPDIFDNVYEIQPKQYYKDANFTMFVRQSMLGYLKGLARHFDLKGGVLIYSMYNGYREGQALKDFLNEIKELGIEIVTLHTSGHASVKDIKLLLKTVKADRKKMVHSNANSFE